MKKKKSTSQSDLDWLFQFNKDKTDFINLINARGGNWAEFLSELIQNLRRKGAQGIQDKFKDLGFNIDNAYVQLKPRFCELEVGDFISDQGENVCFLEGQNSPDMISGIKKFDKIWEISTVFDSHELKTLWIEGDKIIRNWHQKITCDIRSSLRLSNFKPERRYHEAFDKIVKNSLMELNNFDPSMLRPGLTETIETPMIFYELTLSPTSFSGISTFIEGGIEGMASFRRQSYIDSWVSQFQDRILTKSQQIVNNIKKVEADGTNKWEKDNHRFVALISDADIFYDTYFSQTCFGSMDIHKHRHISDSRVIGIKQSDPWFNYVQEHYFDQYKAPLKEPKGVFLKNEAEEIHGVLFISSSRWPIKHQFLANSFVLKNNDPNLIKYLSNSQ